MGKTSIPVQVDLGFGDVVTPGVETLDYPTLLALPAPRIRACPRPTVVAEKCQAMVSLGMANSRMKDFYDLYTLAEQYDFDGPVLVRAVRATFERRKTPLPTQTPLALTDAFFAAAAKQAQWTAFLKRIGDTGGPTSAVLSERLRAFLLPVLNEAAIGRNTLQRWPVGGPWHILA